MFRNRGKPTRASQGGARKGVKTSKITKILNFRVSETGKSLRVLESCSYSATLITSPAASILRVSARSNKFNSKKSGVLKSGGAYPGQPRGARKGVKTSKHRENGEFSSF